MTLYYVFRCNKSDIIILDYQYLLQNKEINDFLGCTFPRTISIPKSEFWEG